MPPARTMARTQHVSVNTVRRAYQELEKDGFIQCKGDDTAIVISHSSGQGRISERQKSIPPHSPPGMTPSFFYEPIEKRELDDQLIKVYQIQMNLLPQKLPENELISVIAHCHPSHIVEGDFYDCIPIDEDKYCFVIADACGNGLPAAMLISQTQAILKSELNNGNGIKQILERMNRQIVQYTPKDRFVTLFFGILDTATREFQYANAGHNYPALMRSNGTYERLQTGGLALGMFFEATYEVGRLSLGDGDILLFFTDGLTEIMDDSQQEYGEHRLINTLARCRYENAKSILSKVLKDVRDFAAKGSQHDDCAIMVVKVGHNLSAKSV